jgi:hypothetical protein
MAFGADARRHGEQHPKYKMPFGIEKVDLPDGWRKDLGGTRKEICNSQEKYEHQHYDPLCEILNKISLEVSKQKELSSAVAFAPHYTKPPRDDFAGYGTKPDIIAWNTSADDVQSRLNSREQKEPPKKGKLPLSFSKRRNSNLLRITRSHS